MSGQTTDEQKDHATLLKGPRFFSTLIKTFFPRVFSQTSRSRRFHKGKDGRLGSRWVRRAWTS